MDTIIVPLDGSELSEQAIAFGKRLADLLESNLELVHVLDHPILSDLLPGKVLAGQAVAQRYLDELAVQARVNGEVATRVLVGDAAAEIVRHAGEQPNSMLVLSTHGRGGLGRVVFGSAADKVLRSATVPVVLVREHGYQLGERLHTIIVPLDGSERAESALPLAAAFARGSGATLSLIRVCEPLWQSSSAAQVPEAAYLSQDQADELEAEWLADARRYLDRIANDYRADQLRVVWEVRTGRPADEIVRAAETTAADFIVLSTSGHGGLRRWFLGSVTSEILQRGTTPILAIPVGMRLDEAKVTDVMAASAD